MLLSVLFLSRLQFALTIMFHYLFPPLTIGLGVIMVIMEGLFLKTRNPMYESMARFWTRIYAVNFAMGVATGIVMEFEFGTNWAAYSRFVGDVFGSALAAEGVFAFFLESGFLAVLVFGWDRVSPRMHFFSTVMVALGSMFSAVWIVVANSWQQTPAGFHLTGAGLNTRAEITDFWAMVFNPSSMDRLAHTLLGAFVLGAFFVMSVHAWYLLRGRHEALSRAGFRIALGVGAAASLLLLLSGHHQADTVARTQPAKLAAFEGHFVTGTGGATLYLFGYPDRATQRVRFGVGVPGGLSLLVHGNAYTPVTGLDAFPRRDQPPVALPFMTYHLMVGLGMLFIGLTLLALFFLWRGTLFAKRRLLAVFVPAVIGPMIANQAGWVSAEVGRQPWIVYGLLRTSDGLSAAVEASQVWWSIILFGVIYLFLAAIWIMVLNDKIRHGPDEPAPHAPAGGEALLDSVAGLSGPPRSRATES
jgi:cytochrome bd ubiquinol oxidase subunit I